MPTVSIERDTLFTHLGHTYTDDEFDELCFEFGIELDEITSEREEALKSLSDAGKQLSKAEVEALSSAVVYKIDVPANRYDLLCIEGLSRALKIFLGEMDAPRYKIVDYGGRQQMVVRTSTADIRPFVVCAVLRDITFTPERYASFIDLQDQLHRNLCRQRTLVAIGTHDLDTIAGPFVYDAKAPTEIQFKPLTHENESFNAKDLMDLYLNDASCKHLKPYVPIIYGESNYPVITDSNGVVLSLPPIINGDHSKITLDTKNVFIECTATDLTKANIVLDTVVTMFSQHCSDPFTVEPVDVSYEDASQSSAYTSPQLFTRTETAPVDFVNSMIGINLSASEMVGLCEKVQLGPAKLIEDDTVLEVTVPPTRSDILHAVDVAEDIGIAFGYNNIVKRVPNTCTVGSEQPLNALGDLLREEISRAGYVEILTHGLSSKFENFTALRKPIAPAVELSNPANIEYEVVRTTLLTGLLKTLQHNKSASFTKGFKIFEISDVVIPDDTHVVCESIVGARNSRRICAVYAGPTSGFEIIHGLVDRIMTLCEVAPEQAYIANSGKVEEEKFRVAREAYTYTIKESTEETYFPGRCADVLIRTPNSADDEWTKIGSFGILHPEVLKNFDIQYPASCVEMNLEPLI